MSIGLVGKIPGVRLITGSRWYGERTRELFNCKFRQGYKGQPKSKLDVMLFPFNAKTRSIMIVGLKAIKYVELPTVAKTRKPRKNKVV